MCIVLISHRTTPGYRLILAANRDEFLDRPTAPLAFWDRERTFLAGRDLRGGGTWLGVGGDGRFAVLTNYREVPQRPEEAASRGEIVAEYLEAGGARAFLARLARWGGRYRGFNLLAGEAGELYYFSNRQGEIRALPAGIYGLSNHLLDSPWPKVVRGKQRFRRVLEGGDFADDELFAVLEDEHRPADGELPQTGIGLEWERLLSAIHIRGESYATRSAALLVMDDEGAVRFRERTYGYGVGEERGEVEEQYRIGWISQQP